MLADDEAEEEVSPARPVRKSKRVQIEDLGDTGDDDLPEERPKRKPTPKKKSPTKKSAPTVRFQPAGVGGQQSTSQQQPVAGQQQDAAQGQGQVGQGVPPAGQQPVPDQQQDAGQGQGVQPSGRPRRQTAKAAQQLFRRQLVTLNFRGI